MPNNSCSGLLVCKQRRDSGFDIYTAEEIDVFTPYRDTINFFQILTNPVVTCAAVRFYPRGCAAPLRGIATIATLEKFVLYCSSELIISIRAPGRGPEGTGPNLLNLKLSRTPNRNTGKTQRLVRRRTHGTYFSLLMAHAISVPRGPASTRIKGLGERPGAAGPCHVL